MQNAHSESFNGRLRDEFLNASWFRTLSDTRRMTEAWRHDYNTQRPHSSLNYQTPAEFARARSEPTSGMSVTPPDRPSTLSDSRTVLARFC